MGGFLSVKSSQLVAQACRVLRIAGEPVAQACRGQRPDIERCGDACQVGFAFALLTRHQPCRMAHRPSEDVQGLG